MEKRKGTKEQCDDCGARTWEARECDECGSVLCKACKDYHDRNGCE